MNSTKKINIIYNQQLNPQKWRKEGFQESSTYEDDNLSKEYVSFSLGIPDEICYEVGPDSQMKLDRKEGKGRKKVKDEREEDLADEYIKEKYEPRVLAN